MQIGSTVTLTYTGKTDDGEVFGYADAEKPMKFQTGMDMAIDGFEREILAMEGKPGEKKTFTISEYDAYGEYLDDFVQKIPIDQIPISGIVPGKRVKMHSSEGGGQAVEATVVSIEDGIETDETTRMKWRYLDIRRPEMLASLTLRHTVAQAMRRALDERGFLEIETPILANSTPEGARDYIVPSRPNPGKFYALPQSPQQFKQMLMCAGVERYYQIARCFRDEDLRADRQPEFTQVDIEMSFVQGDDVMNMMEGVMAEVLKAAGVDDVAFPLQRMPYAESMERFGNDRPDVRFGMELHDITDIVKNTGFKVFSSVAQSGGVVKSINAKGAADRLMDYDADLWPDKAEYEKYVEAWKKTKLAMMGEMSAVCTIPSSPEKSRANFAPTLDLRPVPH